jgi:hypothetical protein
LRDEFVVAKQRLSGQEKVLAPPAIPTVNRAMAG